MGIEILLVTADIPEREILTSLYERAGYRVTSVPMAELESVERAHTYVREFLERYEDPFLVLNPYFYNYQEAGREQPEFNKSQGKALLRLLGYPQRQRPDILLVMTTNRDQDVMAGWQAGISAVCVKPYTTEEILYLTNGILDTPRDESEFE